MGPSFAARRKGISIRTRQDDENDDDSSAAAPNARTKLPSTKTAADQGDQEGPVVKRPPLALRGQTKGIRQSSASLRLSFGQGEGPGAAADEADGGDASGDSAVFTPKKSRLSRQLLERSRSTTPLPLPAAARSGASNSINDDRPSYSKEYLSELRSATPTAPKELSVVRAASGGSVDVAAKFGPQASWQAADNPAIPSEAEIREKKERRARLAREQQAYISLDAEEEDGGDDEDGEAEEEVEGGWTERRTRGRRRADDEDSGDDYGVAVQRRRRPPSSPLHDKWGETRLVRDDEDIAEGFDEFVDDGRIALGRAAERKRKQQEREAIRGLIEEAEGGGGGGDGDGGDVSDDDDDDESEAERRAAYEEAQTRAGAYLSSSLRTKHEARHARSGTPPKITPIPTLQECVARLERTLRTKEERQAQKTQQLREIARRRLEALDRRAEIQRLLEEAGQRYDRLRAEAGMEGAGFHYASSDGGARSGSGYATPNQPDQQRLLPIRLPVERGLESFGDMQTPPAYP